jgi:hypothetical protein
LEFDVTFFPLSIVLVSDRLFLIHFCPNPIIAIIADAQIKLAEFIDEAEALLAEVAAIGGQFHIPPQLQDIVQLKSYVPAGSLDRLAGQDYFLQVVKFLSI